MVGGSMKASYKKLWKLLIDKEINKRTLGQMANVSGSTLTKLVKGESVNMDILLRICAALNCDLHDIVEIVSEKDGE
jgi:DNA-binding Xre family transcriptional regulator